MSAPAPGSTAPTDPELVARIARDDDTAALRMLVERWQTPLLNFFYRSLRDHHRAEELTQTVFVRVYRAADRYEERARFSTYLFQIARRLLINEYRRRSSPIVDAMPLEAGDAIDTGTGERRLAEIEEAFAAALDKLPEKQRTALLLLKQQELSYQEIAEVMQASESAVKTWIHRGRLFLKQALSDWV